MQAGNIGTQPVVLSPASTVPPPNTANITLSTPTGIPTPTPILTPDAKPDVNQGLIDKIGTLYTKYSGKALDSQTQVDTATSPYESQLNQIRQQLSMQQANSLQNQERAMRSGETLGFASREAQNIQRTDAIETMRLTALGEFAQGNLALAEKHAINAVNTQYAQIEADTKTVRNDIVKNYDSMTSKQKKQADAALLQLNEKDAFVAEQKANVKAVTGVISDAVKNGLKDPSVIKQMQDSGSEIEAMQIAAKNGVVSKEMFDRQMDIRKQNFAEQKVRDEMSTAGVGGDPAQMIAYAQEYAATGKIPTGMPKGSFGIVAQLAKESPKIKGALLDRNTGIKPSAMSQKQEDGVVSLSELVQDTLPNLQRLFPKLYTGLIGGIAGTVYTTQDRQDYNTFRAEFLSKLLVARSGATVTPQEYDRYAALLPGTFNQSFFLGSTGEKKLNSMMSSMTSNLNTILNTNQVAIVGFSTVNLGGTEYKVGDEIEVNGKRGRVLADGSIVAL